MLKVQRQLYARLQELKVQIRVVDDDTVILERLPLNTHFYNKSYTNLVVRRVASPRTSDSRGNDARAASSELLLGVDDNLEYRGKDPEIRRLFAGNATKDGWRALYVQQADGVETVVEPALAILGSERREPAYPNPQEAGRDTPDLVGPGQEVPGLTTLGEDVACPDWVGPLVGMESEMEEVLVGLFSAPPCIPVIAGDPGVGKTRLVQALAVRLGARTPPWRMIGVATTRLLSRPPFDPDRAELLRAVLEEAATLENTALVFEQMDLLLEIPGGALLLARAADRGVRMVGTALSGGLSRFADARLAHRTHVVEIPEPEPETATSILMAARAGIEARHGVSIAEGAVRTAVAAASRLPGQLPAKGLVLLERSSARSALSGAGVVGPEDVMFTARRLAR